MTTEARHHTSGSLRTAVALAATAGFVDAFVFLRVTPVFIANMSGNLVHLGIATGGHDGRGVAAAAVALGGFLVGIIVATSHLDRRLDIGRWPSPETLLLLESLLLAALPVLIRVMHIDYSPQIAPADYLLVVVGATAMGIQAVALRRVGQVAVSTTYGTGAVVRLGEKLALALRRAPRPGDVRRRVTIVVLGTVLVSYVLGAAVAAWCGATPELLFVPAAVPLIGSFVLRAHQRTGDEVESAVGSRE